MPFLTQGKTNWKYIIAILVLAVVVGGGALWYAKRPEQPYQPVEIQKTDSEKISIRIYSEKILFNIEDKSFETEDLITKKKFLVITDDSTKFYIKADDKIIGGYNGFSDFAYTMQNCMGISCPLQPTVEGILQNDVTIKATDIYSFVQ